MAGFLTINYDATVDLQIGLKAAKCIVPLLPKKSETRPRNTTYNGTCGTPGAYELIPLYM